MTKEELAAKLGAAENEVLEVEETSDGDVAHMFDGTSYIVDGDGKVWLLAKPTESWEGTFPVFPHAVDAVHPGAPAIPAESAPVEEPAATAAPAEAPVPLAETPPVEPTVVAEAPTASPDPASPVPVKAAAPKEA
jgi:septal ring-binding cell division protein DamX